MLHLHQLEKSFGNRPVLHIPEARMEAGVLWLRGPNGAGKTTLLRILAGLSSFRGTVAFDGTDLRRSPRAYRGLLGWSDAEPVFPEFATGNELLHLVALARGCSVKDAEALGEALGFGTALQQRTGSYSSGMHKKLSLLLAFCGSPRLLLLDEPFSTLDSDAAVALQHHITAYVQPGDRLCLLSSHQEPAALGAGLTTRLLQQGNLVSL